MMRKTLLPILLVVLLAVSVPAESMRTQLTKENRMPKAWRPEVGVEYQNVSSRDSDEMSGEEAYARHTTTPYLRVGVLDNLAVYAAVPYGVYDPDDGGDEAGLGDVRIGIELLPWQDLFGYPYVMPHAEVSLDTGDEDKNLGAGETIATLGLCVGTTVRDIFHWAGDLRYAVHSDRDDLLSLAASLVWDLSERFSVLAEGRVSDRDEQAELVSEDEDDYPVRLQGGMSYLATKRLMVAGYVGYGWNTPEKTFATAKASFAF